MKNSETLTKIQLIRELDRFADNAPIKISVGARSYPISCVISGGSLKDGWAVFLETPTNTLENDFAEVAAKLEADEPLTELERYTAAGAIRDWIARVERAANIGKAKKPNSGKNLDGKRTGRKKIFTPERITELAELKAQGLTLREIGEKFDISESRVSRLLKSIK